MLQQKCEISCFVKSLKFSAISCNHCFTRGFREVTKCPSISRNNWRATGNQYGRRNRKYLYFWN